MSYTMLEMLNIICTSLSMTMYIFSEVNYLVLTLFLKSTSAPPEINNFTISELPSSAATCNGVSP